jgi:hypothetical protein
MASKYYNPRLAASVSAAKNAGFFDAGKNVAEGFKTAFEGASPYVMGALKEYQEDIKKIYDINFDSNGIALDKIEDLTNFLKQQRDTAFQQRQKGIIPGKEATGKALLNVKGAANLAKGHGALAQGIQELLKDPSKISKANEKGAVAMLNSIANAKIDYNDPDGNFFVLGDGSKHSMENLKNELNKLIIEPNEAYNEFFEFVEGITPKKESFEGSTYYTFDEVDINKIQTKLYGIADKYGRDFVWDALSNEHPYRGVTVSQFIDPELKLQGESKSDIEKIIAKKYNLTDSTEIFEKAKELVVQGYTEAAKNTYPGRRKKLKPEKPSGDKLTLPERVVIQVKKDLENAKNTINSSAILNLSKISPVSKATGGDVKNIYQKQLQNIGLNSFPIYETEINKEGEEIQTDKIIGLSVYNPRIESVGEKYFAEDILFGSDPKTINTQIFSALGARYKDISFRIPEYKDPFDPNE